MSMTKNNNKRQYPRIESLNLVSLNHFNKDKILDNQLVCRTLDLSEGGIKLEVTKSVPLFSRLSLMIALKDTLIQVQGEVVFLSAIKENQIEMGLRFIELSDKDKQSIKNYISCPGD